MLVKKMHYWWFYCSRLRKAGYPDSKMWHSGSWMPNTPHGIILYIFKWLLGRTWQNRWNVQPVENEVTSLVFKRRVRAVREQKNETCHSMARYQDLFQRWRLNLRLGVAFLTVGVLKATQLHVKIMKKWRKLRGKVRTVPSSQPPSRKSCRNEKKIWIQKTKWIIWR